MRTLLFYKVFILEPRQANLCPYRLDECIFHSRGVRYTFTFFSYIYIYIYIYI